MNTARQIYRVLVVLTALAMLVSCIPPALSNAPATASGTPTTSTPITPAAPGVSELLTQLADQDAGVRLHAAYQLGELWPTDTDAVEALIRAAEDPDSQVRTVAAYALGKAQVQAN